MLYETHKLKRNTLKSQYFKEVFNFLPGHIHYSALLHVTHELNKTTRYFLNLNAVFSFLEEKNRMIVTKKGSIEAVKDIISTKCV